MSFNKNVLLVSRVFYIKERDRFYSNWLESFWRECFQNSCDAGSRNIDIRLGTTSRRGAFYEPCEDERDVIRVVFQDDGHGMTEDVMRDVFFSPGRTTKGDGNATGGFGRARLATHFANHRYGIRTNGMVAEGEGQHWDVKPVAEILETLGDVRSSASAQTGPGWSAVREQVERDIAEIAEFGAASPKGCRMEIDIDPHEDAEGEWSRRATVDGLRRTLERYLSMSSVPVKVTLNGERLDTRLTLRGMSKVPLTAKRDDGTEFAFANAYWTRSPNAPFRNKMIVRVDGATMFDDYVEADAQVIVEIDRSLSRDVLTSNRDGFKSEFNAALNLFRQRLVVDTMSALDDRADRYHEIEGQKGLMSMSRPKAAFEAIDASESEVVVAAASAAVRQPPVAVSSLERDGVDGVPFHVVREWLRAVLDGEDALLESVSGGRNLRWDVRDAYWKGDGLENVRIAQAISSLEPSVRAAAMAVLAERLRKSQEERAAKHAAKLSEQNDVMVHVKGNASGALRKAISRNDPRKWDPETGVGRKPRQLLAAWTVCVEEALRVLYARHPQAAPDGMDWSTGFVYSVPEEKHEIGRTVAAHTIDAEYVKREDRHYFLLNVVDSEGRINYSLSDRQDLQKMAVLAAHEVAHLYSDSHNEGFASLFTQIAGAFDTAEANRRINQVRKDVAELYAKPSATVQRLSGGDGPGPAQRLVAAQAPRAHLLYGGRSGCEAAKAIVEDAFAPNRDGTVTVLFDRLETAEGAARAGAAMTDDADWLPDADEGRRLSA